MLITEHCNFILACGMKKSHDEIQKTVCVANRDISVIGLI